MKIIFGLGNPGKEYVNTKHNLGFMFIEYLEKKYGFEVSKKFENSLICEREYENEKVVFVKPQTYMNLSGTCVQILKKWYKVDSKDMIVIFDDLDIPFETIRYREKGSGGTHNGMKNIIDIIKTEDIPRIKIGIGGLRHENEDLKNFVLGRFSKEQMEKLKIVFEEVEEKLKEFIKNYQSNR